MPSGRQRTVQRARRRARSMPFWPITTRRLRRASPVRPGAGRTGGGSACRRPARAGASACPIDLHEALHAQHVMRLGDVGEPGDQRGGVGLRTGFRGRSCRSRRGRGLLPHRGARGGGRGRPRPQRRGRAARRRRSRPSRVSTIFTARGHGGRSRPTTLRERVRVEQVGLVEHDEVGAEELVLVDLLQRVVVVDGASSWLRCRTSSAGSSAKRPAATAAPSTTAMTPSTVSARADRRPVERLHQRLGQREARGLDDDVVRPVLAAEKRLDGWDEIVGHGAAQAAIGELDDVFLAAALNAARAQDVAVDADIAELVDDEREAAARRRSRAGGGSASSCPRRGSR